MSTAIVKPTQLAWFAGPGVLKAAVQDSIRRLTPRYQWRNPVMFVVYVGSILTTFLFFQALHGNGEARSNAMRVGGDARCGNRR